MACDIQFGYRPQRDMNACRDHRHERSAAKRASILDGSPGGGYKRQTPTPKGPPSILPVRAFGPRNFMKVLSVTASFSAPDRDFRPCPMGPAARETLRKSSQ